MKYTVIYSSNTGNTKMLAEKIPEMMKDQEFLGCFRVGDQEADSAVKEADLIFIGFWTDKGDCDEKLAEFLKRLDEKKIMLFGTAGFGQSREYFDRILGNVKQHIGSSNVIIGEWMCQGKMPMAVRKRYESMMESQPGRAGELIANFDQALSHPDLQDLEAFRTAVRGCLEKE